MDDIGAGHGDDDIDLMHDVKRFILTRVVETRQIVGQVQQLAQRRFLQSKPKRILMATNITDCLKMFPKAKCILSSAYMVRVPVYYFYANVRATTHHTSSVRTKVRKYVVSWLEHSPGSNRRYPDHTAEPRIYI